ncbi:hypothetical protein CLOSPO_02945 [Clostridium sporogenes ATCC 15579]|jgi:hypothetical protein|nr:hypothetical protein CLOSPO_02945 [Clostridium sporogenes ATCC 15579]
MFKGDILILVFKTIVHYLEKDGGIWFFKYTCNINFLRGNKKWKTQVKDLLGFMYAHLRLLWKDFHFIQQNG